LWLLLCLISGGPCAVFSLEGLLPVGPTALFFLVILSRRVGLLAESLILFGASFTGVAARSVIPDLSIYHDMPTLAYFLGVLSAGVFLVLLGIFLKIPRQWLRYW
jgi:hypothetical protein